MREGKRPDGAMLYPIMPYPFYNRMSDSDAKMSKVAADLKASSEKLDDVLKQYEGSITQDQDRKLFEELNKARTAALDVREKLLKDSGRIRPVNSLDHSAETGEILGVEINDRRTRVHEACTNLSTTRRSSAGVSPATTST